jgi:hypothetical protein
MLQLHNLDQFTIPSRIALKRFDSAFLSNSPMLLPEVELFHRSASIGTHRQPKQKELRQDYLVASSIPTL